MRCQLAKIVKSSETRCQGWLIWVCTGPPEVQVGIDLTTNRALASALRYDIPYVSIEKRMLLMIDAEDVELLPVMGEVDYSSFENFFARGGESWPGDAA